MVAVKTAVHQSDSSRSGRVLRVGPLKPSLMDTLVSEYDALELPEGDERDQFLDAHGESIIAVVTSGRTGVDAALMERLPRLGAVVNFGVGYDATDVDSAAERGIGVSNTPDVLTDCVADLAVGLVIDTVRGVSSAERFVRAGRWAAEGNPPLTRQVTGKRVGIIGMGRIGSAIAHRLGGFRCTVSYHNRHEIDGSPYAYAAGPTALAESVDVLIIAASGGAGTAQLVDRAVLEALGPQGYLINIARGSVVDEEAMIELLAAGQLAGAGLDVFAHEPNVPAALLALDNVVLLPHVGSATVETRAAMEALTLENLDRFLADGTLVTPVTP
ncbi:putative D-3-phosphoglycerate dehydrogenase [Rhodococcus sp. AW25M09]|uniref:2-hydroxyacid dehydrogenase n=1 Tax=Rhodococcus sp. AW25M09 TaxID=1268303 RepID=UPI0002AB9FF8|nr:2-hydroxyacid dehydrogenase [Rhodococcus sp. AW25M09]CCQ13833.1 putative D-3-phosphoglycerate dehydrogenase [Rhodococcus sp. AW25M09]